MRITFSLKIGPLYGGSCLHLVDGSLGQMVSRSVQPFFVWLKTVTDRQTRHATPSVTIGRIYVVVRCGLIKIMQYCNDRCIDIIEIYDVHVYQSTNYLNASFTILTVTSLTSLKMLYTPSKNAYICMINYNQKGICYNLSCFESAVKLEPANLCAVSQRVSSLELAL